MARLARLVLAAAGLIPAAALGACAAASPAPALQGTALEDEGCFPGRWVADLDYLSEQLFNMLNISGISPQQAGFQGRISMEVAADGILAVDVDVTVRFDDGDPEPLAIGLRHHGLATAAWTWVNSPADDEHSVSLTEVDMSGYSADVLAPSLRAGESIPYDVGFAALHDADMQVQCTGDALTTTQFPSAFTTEWRRVS